MTEINLLDKYPQSKRPIEERGNQIKEEHRNIARNFDIEYFDGERLYGYGGYSYHPRFWQETVKRFKEHYQLIDDAKILDVGCAKGFMLHDFKELMPNVEITGVDISEYAIKNAKESVKDSLQIGNAKELPFDDNSFDFVCCINTVHNLPLPECKQAISEIERVSKGNSFITMDAWRNEKERESLLKWNLTALSYMHVDEWKKLFADIGYTGDYYWFLAI